GVLTPANAAVAHGIRLDLTLTLNIIHSVVNVMHYLLVAWRCHSIPTSLERERQLLRQFLFHVISGCALRLMFRAHAARALAFAAAHVGVAGVSIRRQNR